MPAVRTAALALLAVAFAACYQSPTAIAARPPVRLDFLNGPDDLPNVFRTATNAGFAIRDPSTGYIAMAGLPTPPSSITLCGGTMPFQTSSELTEGELKGVLHDLRMGSDLSVFVYQIATFRGVCNSTPFASGVGHAIRTDNDLLTTLTRTNSFGMRIQGVLQDGAGQSYRLNAESHDLIFPDLTFRRVVQNVHLNPVGGP
jgi:hypothetical protein